MTTAPLRSATPPPGAPGRGVLPSRPGIVQQSLHNPVGPRDRGVHLGRDVRIAAPAAEHLDVGAERAERVADLVGHARGQPPDSGELLDPDDLALHVEQLLGHGAVAAGELVQVGVS